jgi:hypothetical protein
MIRNGMLKKRSNKKKLIILLAVLTALIIAVLVTDIGLNRTRSPPKTGVEKESLSSHVALSSPVPDDSASARPPVDPPISPKLTPRTLRSLPLNIDIDGHTAMSVVENPTLFIKSAKDGDGPSAILLFSAVNSCFPIETPAETQSTGVPVARVQGEPVARWPECVKLEPKLAVNRLELLMPAIRSGSAEAKIMYAMTAQTVFQNDEYAGDMQSLYTSDQVNRVAEEYAKQAAAAGVEEAFAFLAKSYFRGEFGLRDPTSAYAYSKALDSLKPNGLGAYLSSQFEKTLTPQQKADAYALTSNIVAQCCR